MKCYNCKLYWAKTCPKGRSPENLNVGPGEICEHFDGGAFEV